MLHALRGRHRGGDGVVRVVQPAPDIASLLTLAFEEIAHYGRDSVQIPRRLRAMLDDLASCSLPQHRQSIAALARQVEPG